MARLLMRALEEAGHHVELVSDFRSFTKVAEEAINIERAAAVEREAVEKRWRSEGAPDLFFCYHPYYKSPDLIGPRLCRDFHIPYVTAEASYASKRNDQGWMRSQSFVAEGLRLAAVNIAFTERDRLGLTKVVSDDKIRHLPPFIDVSAFRAAMPQPTPGRLITVAMMRDGDKHESYGFLAEALAEIEGTDWSLVIVGDGPRRADVEKLFSWLHNDRIEWLGEKRADEVANELLCSSIYVWPGCAEAYGLAYLEAQAAGLPVVAFRTAGVPAVVDDQRTGYLVPDRDPLALANAISELLKNESRRHQMALEARRFVLCERSLDKAGTALDQVVRKVVEDHHGQ